jgi:hypothetical protein
MRRSRNDFNAAQGGGDSANELDHVERVLRRRFTVLLCRAETAIVASEG